jgi:uncharacterized membrane protein SpoIIM required for sporulation
MVLEHLFPENWAEKRLRYALLIAFVYSSIGIIISVLLFGKNSGLISVFLTSLLILPLLEDLLSKEEKAEKKEKKFLFKHLIRDNKEVVVTYLFLFLGIFFTYALYVFVFKLIGYNVLESFQGQLLLDFGKGGATFIFKSFWTIFTNNWWVLLAIFLVALFIKDGAIFFIAWNASSWGVILAYRAITSALYTGGSSIKFFLIVLALTFPFLILEGLAYILAAVSGNILSKDVVRKSKYIKSFVLYSAIGGVIYFILRYLIGLFNLGVVVSIIVQIAVILLILLAISRSIKEQKYKEVFVYNYYLFILAIVLFVLGAIIEVIITQNVDILTKIYSTSMLFSLPI